MTSNRKAFLFIFAFIGVFFGLDRITSSVLFSLFKNSQFRVSKVYFSNDAHDILVLGNSRGVNAFYAPDLAEKLMQSVFNLSFNGLDIETQELLFRDYLTHHPSPRKLILEVTCMQSKDGFHGFRFLRSTSQEFDRIIRRKAYRDWLLCSVCNAYQYNAEPFYRLCYYINRSDQSWINDGVVNPEIVRHWKPSLTEQETWNLPTEIEKESLRRILNLADERNIETSVVMSPFAPGFTEQIEKFGSWKRSIEGIIGPKRVLHDYSSNFQDVSLFADMVHLNRKGSQAFFELLLRDQFFLIRK